MRVNPNNGYSQCGSKLSIVQILVLLICGIMVLPVFAAQSDNKDDEKRNERKKQIEDFEKEHPEYKDIWDEILTEFDSIFKEELGEAFDDANKSMMSIFEDIADKYKMSDEDREFVAATLTDIINDANKNFMDHVSVESYAAFVLRKEDTSDQAETTDDLKAENEEKAEEKVQELSESFEDFEEKHPEYEEAWHEIFEEQDKITREEFGNAFKDVQDKWKKHVTERMDERDMSEEDSKELEDIMQSIAVLLNEDFTEHYRSAYDLNRFDKKKNDKKEDKKPVENREEELKGLIDDLYAFVEEHGGDKDRVVRAFKTLDSSLKEAFSVAHSNQKERMHEAIEDIAGKYDFSKEDKEFVDQLMSSLTKDIDNDFMKSYSMLDFDSFINAEDKAESDTNRPIFVKDDVDVVAVFADGKAQSLKLSSDDDEDAEEIKIDTIWIYYSDNTFEQYAEYADGYEIFSTGTYSFKGDGNFDINEDEKDILVINRDKKVISRETGLTDYESSHEYELGTMGFLQLYGQGDNDKKIAAIFGDDCQLPSKDKYGVIYHLDSVWIMYEDMSFEQFAVIDDDIVCYGDGSYEFDDEGDFHFIGLEENSGKLTLKYDNNLFLETADAKELETITYDIKSLGLTCFYVKSDPDIKKPEKIKQK